jgi:hypothetical protein
MMTTMQKPQSLILAGVIIFTALNSLFAQDKKKSYTEEITVTAPYEPSVTEANKISFLPRITDTTIRVQKQSYLIKPFPMQTTVSIKPLEAARVSGEIPKELSRNYLKGGLGTTSSPYLEFFASSAANANHLVAVHLKHLSSSGSMKDQWFPGFSENLAEVSGKLFTDMNVLSLSAAYSRDVNHYYAPKYFIGEKLRQPSEDSLRQRFGLLNASFEIKSRNDDEEAFVYSLKTDVAHLADYYKTEETNIRVTGMIQKSEEWLTFAEHQYFGLHIAVDNNRLKDSIKTNSATILELFPSYRFLFDEYLVTFGVKTNFTFDSISHLYIYPFIEARVQLVPDRLSASAGINGGLDRSNFNTLRQTNPFISSLTGTVISNEKFNIFVSLKGNIAQLIDLEARFESKTINNMPLFVNDRLYNSHQSRFDVITDDINLIRLLFSARYTGESFHIKLQGNWNNYSTNAEQYAWNCPAIEGQLEAGVSINKHWSLNTEIFSWGDSYAKTWSPSNLAVAKKLKGATDFNIGLNYHPISKFTVFLNMNNILDQRYERWNLYPSFGFNAMAGVSFAF